MTADEQDEMRREGGGARGMGRRGYRGTPRLRKTVVRAVDGMSAINGAFLREFARGR